ncbi:MAG TPA: SIS domain-containing protein [Planctomycetes bacterium]|nr:SIS domain-containing protein [Planctomycetota bacterium]
MFGVTHDVDEYLERMGWELERVDWQAVARLAEGIWRAWEDGQFIFVFGNGGSGATASHFAEDLAKNALRQEDLHDASKRRPRVMSLTDNTPWITAIANDLGCEEIFLQQLMQYGRPGDVVIAISGSGNSPNVLAAVDWANRQGLVTFGLTGYDGGKLKEIQQDGVHVVLDDMGMVESLHLALLHWVVDDLHGRINAAGRYGAGMTNV